MNNKNTYIKEFWEWQKNIYGMYKGAKQSRKELLNFVDNKDKKENPVFYTEKHGEIKLKSIKNGIYYGEDFFGNRIEGSVKELTKMD